MLGVGLGAIPFVASELIETDQRWRDLVTHVKTVETQCFQIWLKDDMAELGWGRPSVALSAFAQPFETWADMSHLIEEERGAATAAIAYFCSTHQSAGVPPLSDASYPKRRLEQVRSNAVRFLDQDLTRLWSEARKDGGFKWDSLVDRFDGTRKARTDRSRFASQFWVANVDPTSRYVLSVPGSQKYRISPLDYGYDNLRVTGDWTACGLDTGCVEAAFIAGRLAAHSIAGRPRLEEITGYDHP